MLKRLLTECILTVDLTATGRLMVKDPPPEAFKKLSREERTEMQVAQPVKTTRPDGSDSLYLPGASLKGVLRAQAERIARSLNEHGAGACDPFTVLPKNGGSAAPDLACSERITVREKQPQKNEDETPELSRPQRYSDVCPICRTFGHIGWGRRLRITDFYPASEPGAVEMTHIGIDRVGGGVSTTFEGMKNGKEQGTGRTFTVEYAYKAHFTGQIIIENFELWQLGLLGFLWRDLAEGLIPLGHKQTTGSGELAPHLREMRLTRLGGSQPDQNTLPGVGSLFAGAESYGYNAAKDVLTNGPNLSWTRPAGDIRWVATLDQAGATQLWGQLGPLTAQVLRDHRWAEAMDVARLVGLNDGN